MTSLDLARLLARARHQADVENTDHGPVTWSVFECLPMAHNSYQFRCDCGAPVAVTSKALASVDADKVAAMQFRELVAAMKRGGF